MKYVLRNKSLRRVNSVDDKQHLEEDLTRTRRRIRPPLGLACDSKVLFLPAAAHFRTYRTYRYALYGYDEKFR